jgi:tight adherence protein B
MVGFGIIGLAIGFYIIFQGKDEVGERISHFIEATPSSLSLPQDDSDTSLDRFRRQFNNVFAILNSDEMLRKLVAANWPISVSEYLFIQIGATIFAFLLGLLIFRNIIPGIGLALVVYLTPGFLLFRSIQGRQKLFQNQLIDSLTLIRGAVAAGYSFQQALNVVIQEMASPTSDEFRQVRREVELGLPLSRALSNMASRMESDDFNLVATVVIINMQVGGNLTNILNVVIETIRQRIYLFSEVRALTAYANFAGYLLTLMPFLTMAILSILSPVYWQQLFEPGPTRYVLIYAACSLAIGNILLRRIAKIQI